jgi:hypothetical protein
LDNIEDLKDAAIKAIDDLHAAGSDEEVRESIEEVVSHGEAILDTIDED